MRTSNQCVTNSILIKLCVIYFYIMRSKSFEAWVGIIKNLDKYRPVGSSNALLRHQRLTHKLRVMQIKQCESLGFYLEKQ